MPDLFVLDAGVLFSTWPQRMPEGKFVTAPSVLEEVRNRPSRARLESMVSLDRITETQPSHGFLLRVRSAARATGDKSVLSDADIELIALALELKMSHSDVAIVSSDLAVLNTAASLEIAIIDPTEKFRKRIKWTLKCPACGHVSPMGVQNPECPVCGTEMRRVSVRGR
jgi:UPF0271 protein